MFSGRSEDNGAVSAANYKAVELGIKSGMGISDAKHLARGYEFQFLPADKKYYPTVPDKIMDIMEVMKAKADLMQQVSTDEAYLDITEKAIRCWNNSKMIA